MEKRFAYMRTSFLSHPYRGEGLGGGDGRGGLRPGANTARSAAWGMAVLSVVLVTVLWGAFAGVLWAVTGHIRALLASMVPIGAALERLADHPEESFRTRLVDLEEVVDRLPKKWDDIKREASASEARARSHVKRVQKELEERGFTDAGVDQVGYELGLVDGGRGEDGSMQPVPEDVAHAESVEAGPEDWEALARSRKFGG